MMSSSSFETRRLNSTTFFIQEHDAYGERPLIYAKLPPQAPVLILTDTGCDEPDSTHKHDRYIHLRDYLENHPIACNNHKPLNPQASLYYIIICTHCHYDHIGGITQFLPPSGPPETKRPSQVIASSYGKDFLDSEDFDKHSLFKYVNKPVPFYYVTKWAQAFENLYHEAHGNKNERIQRVDLDVKFILVPGHTPDSLAWYDTHEMWLYVGDNLYEEIESDERGAVEVGAEIVFPSDGNLVEWVASIRKLLVLTQGENARAERQAEAESEASDFIVVPKRVRLAAGHVTSGADAEELLKRTDQFMYQVLQKNIPVIKKEYHWEEVYFTWRQEGWNLSLKAPPRLIDQAQDFFDIHGPQADGAPNCYFLRN